MLPLLPVDVIHRILETYSTTSCLLRDADIWAENTRSAWMDCPSIGNTVIPDYDDYSERYCTIFGNPFDVDWREVDVRDVAQMSIIRGMWDVMAIEARQWSDDLDTAGCEIFWNYIQFMGVVGRVLEHTCSETTLGIYLTANVLAPAA